MKILAIDPGTKCGWALKDGSTIISGVWNLKGGRFEGGGMRFLRLKRLLDEILPVDELVFEEVRGHKGCDAAHIYGGIVAVISSLCEENNIPYQGIPVGTVKKHATGKGNANKEAMLDAARARWPEQNIVDDNQADALWILDCATNGNNDKGGR